VLPFLYRTAIFYHACLPPLCLTVDDVAIETEEDEFSAALTMLSLPSLHQLVRADRDQENQPLPKLVSSWMQGFFKAKSLEQGPSVAPALPFELCRDALPELYQDLAYFKSPKRVLCSFCETVPSQPALCLICGQLICFSAKCCASVGGTGEANLHAQECGAGEGAFLLLKQTLIVMLRYKISGCFWLSPYLDAHGEEDEGLRRGRPLFLDMERYEQLRTIWTRHQVANTIAKESAAHQALGFIQWHRM